MVIILPCVPSLAAIRRGVTYNDDPEIIFVYVDYIDYGRTHRHSLKHARLTHQKIRDGRAIPAYSLKGQHPINVWLDKAVKGIIDPDAEHLPFKKMDPNKTETGVLHNFTIDPKIYYAGCPAPRKIIADTGAAVDLIGSRDLHHKDKQKKTSEPIHFRTANGHTKADTVVQD